MSIGTSCGSNTALIAPAARTSTARRTSNRLARRGTRGPEAVALGVERTIEQDPAFALRIIVDIGIKALSPAVNDPTSAVQILDYIETFLHRICTADLRDQYPYADRTGIPRVEIPGRTWAVYLQLAVTEIRRYGTHSVQVCRRLRSLLNGLLVVAAPRSSPGHSG